MPAKTKEANLKTRNARTALPTRVMPYYRRVLGDLHLGYYSPRTRGLAGSWIARRYLGKGHYETGALGLADDRPDVPADGEKVLTFDQAQAAAQAWLRKKTVAARAAEAGAAVVTVRAAVAAYIEARKARDARTGRDAELRLGRHVLNAKLADTSLADLTPQDFTVWRKGLKRGGRAGKGKALPLAPATLARLLNDLRAAMADADLPSDKAEVVKKGLKAPEAPDRAREAAILTDADVRKVVAAAYDHDPDLGALVMVLASTGCRFDQAARIRVSDFQPEAARVMIPVSRKGRGTKKIPFLPTPLTDDVVKRLLPLLAGRAGHELLLTRWHRKKALGKPKAGALPGWERDGRRGWSVAADMSRPWKAAVAAAALPPGTVPYALRHSSIVRGLRAGLSARLVAAAHDTSTAMIETHYSAFIMNAEADLLRRALTPMAPADISVLRPATSAA